MSIHPIDSHTPSLSTLNSYKQYDSLLEHSFPASLVHLLSHTLKGEKGLKFPFSRLNLENYINTRDAILRREKIENFKSLFPFKKSLVQYSPDHCFSSSVTF